VLHLIVLFSLLLAASSLPRFRSLTRHKRTKAPCEDLGGACTLTDEECADGTVDDTGECSSGLCCILQSVNPTPTPEPEPSEPEPEPAPVVVDPPLDLPEAELVVPTCGAHVGEETAECLSTGDPNCSNCIGAYDGACVAQWALYVGYQWRVCGMRYSQGADRHVGLCNTHAARHSEGGDCSSFVTTVLQQAGYRCLTRALHQMISTLGYRTLINSLQGTYHKESPVVGDIIMWEHGNTGHIGLVYEVQADCIRLVNEGGPDDHGPSGWDHCHPYDPANPHSFIPHASGGVAGYKGFWTPVPKS